MSWRFRVLVFGLLVTVGLGPQLACFMPDQPAARSDMECCKEMIGACTAPNSSSDCCQMSAPAPPALAAKAVPHVSPRLALMDTPTEIASHVLFAADRQTSRYADPGPPDELG